MKYCVILGEVATDTYKKIQKAFGNDSASRAQVFRGHKDFVNGRETVEDKPPSRRCTSVRTSTNVDHVWPFIRQDRRMIIPVIADELNINERTVQQIVTQNLNMRRVCAKMVPKNLNNDQKER
jgi:hypothetical protein